MCSIGLLVNRLAANVLILVSGGKVRKTAELTDCAALQCGNAKTPISYTLNNIPDSCPHIFGRRTDL